MKMKTDVLIKRQHAALASLKKRALSAAPASHASPPHRRSTHSASRHRGRTSPPPLKRKRPAPRSHTPLTGANATPLSGRVSRIPLPPTPTPHLSSSRTPKTPVPRKPQVPPQPFNLGLPHKFTIPKRKPPGPTPLLDLNVPTPEKRRDPKARRGPRASLPRMAPFLAAAVVCCIIAPTLGAPDTGNNQPLNCQNAQGRQIYSLPTSPPCPNLTLNADPYTRLVSLQLYKRNHVQHETPVQVCKSVHTSVRSLVYLFGDERIWHKTTQTLPVSSEDCQNFWQFKMTPLGHLLQREGICRTQNPLDELCCRFNAANTTKRWQITFSSTTPRSTSAMAYPTLSPP